MTTTTIEIFYRSKEDVMANWYSEPALETLANTHVQLPITSEQIGYTDECEIDYIFFAMNGFESNPLSVGHPTGGLQDWMEEVGIGHTSMSVGDVVSINGTYYACARSGWTQL
tara:strand:+ start:346 stop:684 length:339 start_codon:yes stop_codon:yes gene_type:complete